MIRHALRIACIILIAAAVSPAKERAGQRLTIRAAPVTVTLPTDWAVVLKPETRTDTHVAQFVMASGPSDLTDTGRFPMMVVAAGKGDLQLDPAEVVRHFEQINLETLEKMFTDLKVVKREDRSADGFTAFQTALRGKDEEGVEVRVIQYITTDGQRFLVCCAYSGPTRWDATWNAFRLVTRSARS